MLCPDDADLVRRDAALPGLAAALDPVHFAETLRDAMPEVTVGAATCHYLRYKPQTSCLAAYHVLVDDQPHNIVVEAYRADAQDKLRKVRKATANHGKLDGLPPVVEPAALALWLFPHDRRLKGLARLLDPGPRRLLLQSILPATIDLRQDHIGRVRYKPERRYVAQLRLRGGGSILLKAYDPPGFAAAQRTAKVFASRGPLRIADRLGRSNRHHVVALEWLPGRLLADRISDRSGTLPLEELRRVGTALGELHIQTATGLLWVTRDDTATALRRMAETVGWLHPPLARRAADLAGRIAAALLDLKPTFQSIHGDFYAQQVLLDGQRIGLLDLDSAAQGDPATDLGNFIAHLEWGVETGRYDQDDCDRMAAALVDGYGLTGDRSVRGHLGVYVAASLFGLAASPFRARDADWVKRMTAIVDRSAAQLPGGRGRWAEPDCQAYPAELPLPAREPVVIDPFDVRHDAQMPQLAAALDPTVVQALLARHAPALAGKRPSARVHAVRVVRYKAQRRCLIQYHLAPSDGQPPTCLLAKVQAKRIKPDRFACLQALYRAGFDQQSRHEVSIPEPVAVIPELRMWLQRRVPGSIATHFLLLAGGQHIAEQIAGAIHRVHQAGVAAPTVHGPADELTILQQRLPAVAQSHPQWSGRIARLLDACGQLVGDLPEATCCGIHRDFYPDQVVVDGRRLYLVDFDLYCRGDPALDAGNFAGHLIELGLRRFGNPDRLKPVERAFVERFLTLSVDTAPVAVDIYTTMTLARHVSLSTQFHGRRHLTERILEICEQRLGRPRPTPVLHPSG